MFQGTFTSDAEWVETFSSKTKSIFLLEIEGKSKVAGVPDMKAGIMNVMHMEDGKVDFWRSYHGSY